VFSPASGFASQIQLLQAQPLAADAVLVPQPVPAPTPVTAAVPMAVFAIPRLPVGVETVAPELPPTATPAVASSARLPAVLVHVAPPAPTSLAPTPHSPLNLPRRDAARMTLLARLRQIAVLSWRVLRWALALGLGWFATMLLLIGLFRFVDPPLSMLMLTQKLSGQEIQQTWVPLAQISTNLRRAVLISEDGKFCRHWGFDLGEIRAALKAGEMNRGASTVTQQLAKNLFLWPGKSYVRKALEVPLTVAIEAVWPKWRIFEVYLNVAEWGPGVFGAQAAANSHFDKPASQLNEREAALLAVVLPNPISRDAADPRPAIVQKANMLRARMRVAGATGCVISPP
jgi:monofunctional glycosyltransferase